MPNESLRQEALQAMGLPVLVSRFCLSGAKVSEPLSPDELDSLTNKSSEKVQAQRPASNATIPQAGIKPETPVSVASASQASTANEQSVMAEMKALFDTKPKSSKTSNKSTPSNSTASDSVNLKKTNDSVSLSEPSLGSHPLDMQRVEGSEQSAEKTAVKELRFRHWFFQVDDVLFIVDPLNAETVDSNPEALLSIDDATLPSIKRFLRDIYFFSFDKQPQLFAQNHFDWPPNKKMPAAIKMEDMAYSTEQAFIATLAQQQVFEKVVVFSSRSLVSLFNEWPQETHVSFELRAQLQTLQEKPAIVCEALQVYFQQPHTKAQLWKQLQRLKPIQA